MIQGKDPTSFFACGHPTIVPVPFVEETVHSPLNGFDTLIGNELIVDIKIYF